MYKAGADREGQAQWSSRSVGSNLQHDIFYFLIRYGGRKVSYILLDCVAFYYALFRPSIRKRTGYYLARRFGTGNRITRLLHCYRIYVNLGKALVDRAAIGIKGIEYVRTTSRGLQELKDLVGEGKGIIMLTAHVGCWQAAMAELYSLGAPVSLLLHREEGDIDRHYFEHAGIEAPFRIIDPLGYMGGVFEMMEVLKKGEVLSIMGDRIFGSDRKTVVVDFLGGKVKFPYSAFKLASATGAPIAILFSYNNGPGSYEMSLEKVMRIPSDLGNSARAFYPYVAQFSEALGSYTQRYPYQFFNFFDMWEKDEERNVSE